MCKHASTIPASMCSVCTPVKRTIARPPFDTSLIIHDQETSDRFDAQAEQIDRCLVFQHGNPAQWGFLVNTTVGAKITTPARYALSRAGRRATDVQVVRCTCGRVGDQHGNGTCANPDHLIAY